MKLKTIAVAVALLVCGTASAVDVKLNLHMGVTAATPTTTYEVPVFDHELTHTPGPIELRTSIGFAGGFGVDINNIVGGFGITTGFDFMERKMDVNWNNIFVNDDIIGEKVYKVRYWTIPLCVNYRLDLPGLNKVVVPTIYTGPSVSFSVGQTSFFSNAKSPIIDWKVGANFTLLSHYQIGVAYNLPLMNFSEFDTNYQKGVENKLKYWMFTIGYEF